MRGSFFVCYLRGGVSEKELAGAGTADQNFYTMPALPACVPGVPALVTGHGVLMGEQQVEDWLRANK